MRKRRPVVELLARALPRGAFLRLYGLAKTGAWPDLRRPRRFSEHLLRRMLDPGDELPLMVRTGDKHALRGFVEERLGPGHLARQHDLLVPGERVTADRMARWPARVVLKASHASRWMAFVDRRETERAALDDLVQGWLRRSYASVRQEPHYAAMAPRVVVEEDLRRGGDPPADVKLFVFHGEPRFVVVDQGRLSGLRRLLLTPAWQPLAVGYREPPPDVDPPAPAALGRMIEVARELARGLAFVRVDLYEVDGRVLVGEMTHFPSAGAPRFDPRAFDDELGAVWRERRPVAERWRRSVRKATP